MVIPVNVNVAEQQHVCSHMEEMIDNNRIKQSFGSWKWPTKIDITHFHQANMEWHSRDPINEWNGLVYGTQSAEVEQERGRKRWNCGNILHLYYNVHFEHWLQATTAGVAVVGKNRTET